MMQAVSRCSIDSMLQFTLDSKEISLGDSHGLFKFILVVFLLLLLLKGSNVVRCPQATAISPATHATCAVYFFKI